ncbi:MAG: DNA polymerase IV [bacterium]
MSRIVFHVDMDAFYASVEVRDDPSLRGVPLVVGADPRGGKGRGVVCTASYEARKYGIKSAMPIAQAYRLAPHARFIPPDFSKYGPASDAVMQVLERYAGTMECVGLDEAYLDVTERCGGDWDAARSLAHSLQAAVRRETRLSCSIGVAPSKSVAKIASDRRKPHGVTVVPPQAVTAFLEPLPVRAANGCGPKTAAALAELGIHTIGQLAQRPRPDLERAFGTHGAWLWQIANGLDDRPVVAEHGERKSRGNETTFLQDERDTKRVVGTAIDLLDESLERSGRRDARAFSTVTVKVRYTGFVTLTRASTAAVPYEPGDPDASKRAKATVAALLEPLLDGRGVRLVGVRLSGFVEPTGQRPLTAFGLLRRGVDRPTRHVAGLLRHGIPVGAFDPGGLRWRRLEAF